MSLQGIKDVLTFASFRPEPDDSTSSWSRRFPRQSTLLLNVGKNRTSWCSLAKGKSFTEHGSDKGEFKEVAGQSGALWKPLTDGGWTGVSLNTRYVISLETNLSRKKDSESLIRANPRAVLGAKAERAKRYAVTHNPETNSSLLLSCDDDLVKKTEASLKEQGLQAGRICVGTYAMLRRLLAETNPAVPPTPGSGSPAPSPPSPNRELLHVVCNEGSVCALTQRGDAWTEFRSRTDVYDEEGFEPLWNIVSPLVDNLGDEGEIVLVCDREGTGILEYLLEQMPGRRITDLTRPNHLWATLAETEAAKAGNSSSKPPPPTSATPADPPAKTETTPPPLPPPAPARPAIEPSIEMLTAT